MIHSSTIAFSVTYLFVSIILGFSGTTDAKQLHKHC